MWPPWSFWSSLLVSLHFQLQNAVDLEDQAAVVEPSSTNSLIISIARAFSSGGSLRTVGSISISGERFNLFFISRKFRTGSVKVPSMSNMIPFISANASGLPWLCCTSPAGVVPPVPLVLPVVAVTDARGATCETTHGLEARMLRYRNLADPDDIIPAILKTCKVKRGELISGRLCQSITTSQHLH